MNRIANFYKVILFIFIAISCHKEENVLPEVTQEGKNTFGMYLNGHIWTPYVPSFIGGGQSPNAHYSQNKWLLVYAENFNQNDEIYFYIPNVTEIGLYHISFRYRFSQPDSNYYEYKDSTRYYRKLYVFSRDSLYLLTDSSKAIVNISRLDTNKKIVSGTFYMTLENYKKDIINITDGRFDIKYNDIVVQCD